MKHSAILFSLDGTLLDTLHDLTAAINHAMEKGGYPAKTPEEVRICSAKSMGDTIRKAVPRGTTWEESWELIEPANQYYAENCTENTKPYDGILEMLDTMKAEGVKIAVLTNKPEEAAKEMVAKYFGDRVDAVVGEKEGTKKKPAPDMIFEAMAALNADRAQVAMVGDSDADVQMAKNAGVPCVSVTWGFKDRHFLENHCAKVIVDTPAQLLETL